MAQYKSLFSLSATHPATAASTIPLRVRAYDVNMREFSCNACWSPAMATAASCSTGAEVPTVTSSTANIRLWTFDAQSLLRSSSRSTFAISAGSLESACKKKRDILLKKEKKNSLTVHMFRKERKITLGCFFFRLVLRPFKAGKCFIFQRRKKLNYHVKYF